MSRPTTSRDTTSTTSSPGSADGASRCDSPDGPMTDLFGQALAPVNRSAQQAKAKALPMKDTYGPPGSGSLSSAALASSLVSRLRQRLSTAGSTLFKLTWKESATPSGRSVCLLRASALRTSEPGCGSWPTPNAGPQNDGDTTWEQRRAELKTKHGNGNGFGLTLGQAVTLASWPTASARDWKDTSGMSTTGTNPDGSQRTRLDQLPRVAGLAATGSPAATEKPGQLNPAFSLYLMGYSRSWLECAPSKLTGWKR